MEPNCRGHKGLSKALGGVSGGDESVAKCAPELPHLGIEDERGWL